MNIELKDIKFSEALSEETNAFFGVLYVNGIKVAHAKNDGRGGCTFYHLCDAKHRELLKQAEDFCLALPSVDYGDMKLPMNLEFKIDLLFEEWLRAKDEARLKNKLKKSMINNLCVKTQNGFTELSWKSGKRKVSIAELLSVEKGRTLLKTAIQKQISEGKEILNTNIPQEFFQ